MSSTSPVTVLYSSDGYELSVSLNAAIPSNTKAIIAQGSDGTNARPITLDSSGRVVVVQSTASNLKAQVVGAGTAGTADAGVVTIQGIAGMTAVKVDGSGVTQPVSGTITANIGTTNGLALDATLTGGTQRTKITDGTNNAAVKAASTAATASDPALVVTISPNTPLDIRNDGYATTAAPTYSNNSFNPLSLTTSGLLRVDGSAVTQPVSGTVTANAGTGNFTVTQATAANLNATVVGNTNAGSGASTGLVTVQGNASGTPIPVTTNKASTGSLSSVAAAVTSTQLLASNANRVSATFFNDSSTAILYLALSSTASQTAFSVRVMPMSYWELPTSYTGVISGIWNSATGACRVTELT